MMRESFNKDLIDWINTTLTLNEVFRSLSRKPVIFFFFSSTVDDLCFLVSIVTLCARSGFVRGYHSIQRGCN